MLLADGTGYALRLKGAAIHSAEASCLMYNVERHALPDDMMSPSMAGQLVDEKVAVGRQDAMPASLCVYDVSQATVDELAELCDGAHGLFMHEHRNIVHTYAAFVCSATSVAAAMDGGDPSTLDAPPASGVLCVVQEDAQRSCTLADYMRLRSTAQLSRPGAMFVAAIAYDVLEALAYLHDRGHSVHRHLTPANLRLDGAAGCVKLGAMQHAATLDCLTQCCAVAGSVGYMAPEVLMYTMLARSPGVVPRTAYGMGCKADMWSLGIVLLELVSATSCQEMDRFAPYMRAVQARQTAGNTAAQEAARSEEQLLTDLDTAFGSTLVDVIGQCLRVEPETRPSARELLRHSFSLEAHQEGALTEQKAIAYACSIRDVVESVAGMTSVTLASTVMQTSGMRHDTPAAVSRFVWTVPDSVQRTARDRTPCTAAATQRGRSRLDSAIRATGLESQRAVLRVLRQLEAWRGRLRQNGVGCGNRGGGSVVGPAAGQASATQAQECAAEAELLSQLDAIASRRSRERVVRLFAELTHSIRALQACDAHDDVAGQLCEFFVTQAGRDEASVMGLLRHEPLAQLLAGGLPPMTGVVATNHEEVAPGASPSPPPSLPPPPPSSLSQRAPTLFGLEQYAPLVTVATPATTPVALDTGLTRRALERCLAPTSSPLLPPRKTPEATGRRGGATVSPMDYLFAHGVQRLYVGRPGAQP